MPIVQRLDIDLIWFGVLYLICMQLGCCCRHTPAHDDHARRCPAGDDGGHFRAVVPYIVLSLVPWS